MPNNKSIGYRLSRASNTALRLQIAQDWVAEWQIDQTKLIDKLYVAIINQYDQKVLENYIDQIDAMSQKKFAALPNVLKRLSNTD